MPPCWAALSGAAVIDVLIDGRTRAGGTDRRDGQGSGSVVPVPPDSEIDRGCGPVPAG